MTEEFVPFDDLVWACTNLCELLEVENDALANHDTETVRDLAENKTALANLYEKSMIPIAENPALLDGLDLDQREELKALGARLAQLASVNEQMLMAEMQVCQMVLEVVVDAAKQNAASTVSYGPKGRFDVPDTSPERQALAFNKTL